jgi:hypothetical protein
VFIEPTLPDSPGRNWAHPRGLSVHTLPNTVSILGYYRPDTPTLSALLLAAKDSAVHLLSALARATNVGELSGHLSRDLPADASGDEHAGLEQNLGFVPLTNLPPEAMLRSFRHRHGKLAPQPSEGAGLDPFVQARVRWYSQLIEAIRQIPAEPIFLLSPAWHSLPEQGLVKVFATELGNAYVLDGRGDPFTGPLFTPEYWADPDHLNLAGASWYSSCIAAQFQQR